MTAGRPPKPTAIRMLHGNPGKRALPKSEPKPPVGPVRMPAWLDDDGKKAWKWIAPVLRDMGVLTTADQQSLALLCDAYSQFLAAREAIAEHGLTYESETQSGHIVRPRPEVAIAADAWRRVTAMLIQFGMTPSARTKVHGQKADDDVDPMEALLSGRRSG